MTHAFNYFCVNDLLVAVMWGEIIKKIGAQGSQNLAVGHIILRGGRIKGVFI